MTGDHTGTTKPWTKNCWNSNVHSEASYPLVEKAPKINTFLQSEHPKALLQLFTWTSQIPPGERFYNQMNKDGAIKPQQ